MVTTGDLKMPPAVGIDSRFYGFDPCAMDTKGDLILTFTGRGTGMATNTGTVVNYKSKVHGKSIPKGVMQRLFFLCISEQHLFATTRFFYPSLQLVQYFYANLRY